MAGWDDDAPLERNGVESQSNILNMSRLPDLRRIVEGIPEYGGEHGRSYPRVPQTNARAAGIGRYAGWTRPSAVRPICATFATTIGARPLTASMPASIRPSTASMRIPSDRARSTAGIRAVRTGSFRRSSGYAPCGASSTPPWHGVGEFYRTPLLVHGREHPQPYRTRIPRLSQVA